MLSTREKGGAQHRARCQAHLRAGNSKLLESLIHPKEAALGRDVQEAQESTVSKVQEHWSGGWGWSFPSTSVNLGNRGALAQGSSAALVLIQPQIQNETLGKTSKGK